MHLRQKTQSPSHIPISEGRLHLRCLWKVSLPLQLKTGNHSHPEMRWVARNIPQAALLKLKILYIEKVVSGNLSRFLKGVKPLVLYDVDLRVVMEQMQGKLSSSQIDFGYTQQFCLPGVTSLFFSSCDSVVGDSLEFNQANRGSLHVLLGKRNCSEPSAGESGLISQRGESLIGFLELRQEPVEYSRVTAGMSIRNWSLFSEVRTPV